MARNRWQLSFLPLVGSSRIAFTQDMSAQDATSPDRRQTMIIAGSMFGGLLAAAALIAIPFADARESVITGAILLGFAFGWALMAVLSARIGDRPQRWAVVPATAMALTGACLVVLAPSAATITTVNRVWPPLLLALVIWMTGQARRRSAGWPRRAVLYPVFGVLALVSTGGAYEALRTSPESAVALADRHGLVDVGGHRLRIQCSGSGSPTVVLEPGLGESAAAMAHLIAPTVAQTTKICVYDQAGHGRSDAAPGNRTDAARDLHVLLERSHIRGPSVIAGHSLGGIFALSYAARYPRDVAGIVLLDSMHPKQATVFDHADPLISLVPTLSRTGIASLLFDAKDGDPGAQMRQMARDVEAMPAEMNRAAKLKTLGDRPLAVITADKGNQPGWRADQDRLATLSSDSTHRIIAGSTHASLIDDRAHAAQSSRAIRDIVRAVRTAGAT